MGKVRLFVAVETPDVIRPAIRDLQATLRRSNADVRWESPEKFHVTVKFIGEQDAGLVQDMRDVLHEIALRFAPFTAEYAGVGCFPNRRHPKVIWVGVRDRGGILEQAYREIETAMTRFGCARDDREFHPHVTLGRVRGDTNMSSLLATMESVTFQCPPVLIDHIVLMKSDLTPAGSRYAILSPFTFTAIAGTDQQAHDQQTS